MNIIQTTVTRYDRWQQRHTFTAFVYAVVKKYGDDQAGYHAALLTYYGFLALFPLLLVVTTIAGVLVGDHPHLQTTIVDGMTNYFPVLGSQLSDHVHTLHKTGLALLVGIVFTFYGARGVADVFRRGVRSIWGVTQPESLGFPKGIIKSLGLVVVGGVGLIVASVGAGLAASAGRGLDFRLLSVAVNVFILFWLFNYLLNAVLPQHVSLRDIWPGAAAVTIGLVILQTFGGYLLTHELKSLDALYSNFAIALGLLFWIYLQAQIFYYSVEIASVRAFRAWPRSMDAQTPTKADRRLQQD